MRVCFVGPSQSGKSSLFAAVVEAGGSSVDLSRADQPHLAMVKVPDERLDWLTDHYSPEKHTPAELELLDLPGFNMADEAGRSRSKTHWPAMRQSDCLVFVVRSFASNSVMAYRDRIDPTGDVEELRNELLFADLEQVSARVTKLEGSVKKPTPKQKEQQQELELMRKLLEALENEQPLSDAITNENEAKQVRSFGFLSQKPALVVVNCDEDAAAAEGESVDGLPTVWLSAAIEADIAQLDDEDRAEFMADLGLTASASDRLIQACYAEMKLISFLTAGEDECRAWTIPAGMPAVDAAGKIHSDISRGFIRAETVAFADLQEGGGMKEAKAAGKIRLEGKEYPVADGDIINFRFNV